ncbi:MAG: class I SAM-dependent methyltransferase [Thermoleophilaceae bacterium]
MSERSGFYRRVLGELLEAGVIRREHRVLVIAGGPADAEAFRSHGFTDVTLSNLDETMSAVGGYEWTRQDAESLDLPDGSFDWTVVSAGLHHCRSPHRGLLEMLRVARRGVLAIEARDSLLTRAAVRLGVTDEYELVAVAAHDFRGGGVRNTATPNYVYRWTERELEKTVASAAPHAEHEILTFREFELPLVAVRRSWAALMRIAEPLARALVRVAPRQANLIAFAVLEPGELQPWMRSPDQPDADWINRRLGRGG